MGEDNIDPIADRVGHVGGIESIVVDGRRWFFGIDAGLDRVVSPLIDDEGRCRRSPAATCANAMVAHDEAYWRMPATNSIDYSDLTSDDTDREFASDELAVWRLWPSSHLLYLLGAAARWPKSFFLGAPPARLSPRGRRRRPVHPGSGDVWSPTRSRGWEPR
jgi:hypothetical protein